MNHPDEGLIHDYVDDELAADARPRVTAHLADCADCRAIVASARKLKEDAVRMLDDSAEPVPAHQWDRIEERIRAAGAPVIALPVRDERAGSRIGRRVAVAAALVLLAAAGTFAYRAGGPPAPIAQNEPTTDAVLASVESQAPAAGIADAYAPVFAQLEGILSQQRDQLQPETIATLEANLVILNKAISDIQAALEADPANRGGLDALDGIYQAKLGLLRGMVTLAPEV